MAKSKVFATPWQDPVWVSGRACAGLDPMLFFPTSSRGNKYANAQSVCALCPVLDRCATYFVDDDSEAYIGGMTLDDRLKARKAFTKVAS